MTVTTIGGLNLIKSVYFENSMRVGIQTERDMQKELEEIRREQLEQLKRVFVSMDVDKSGYITKDEFSEAMANNDILEHLAALGLAEESDLFDKIDADKSGTIEFDEFFVGIN